MDALFNGPWGDRTRTAVFVVVVLLAIFLGLKSVGEIRTLGAGADNKNTITVQGYGESTGVPDIATFSYSVVSLKPTVEAAQDEATTKANAVATYLKEAGVEDRDVQTSNYQIYPQYDWVQDACINGRCPAGRQVLRGYEARQSVTVKVRDLAKAGELLAGVGSRGATEVSGLMFTFDDPHRGQDEAREMAIADAKAQAEKLAGQLGVRVVRLVSFSESSGGMPPMPYAAYGRGGAESLAQDASNKVVIAPGENKVTSTVSVTYEIR